jgi:hypothetical protein
MLTVTNLDTNRITIKEIKGTEITLWALSQNREDDKYVYNNFSLENSLEKVGWTSKKEYNDLYPEDEATNKDAKHITIYFDSLVVDYDYLFVSTGTNRKGNMMLSAKGFTNSVSISFKNSTLAMKAKKYLDAYKEDQKER